MIEAERFIKSALSKGMDTWSGVPCSFLTPFINYVIQDQNLHYYGATSEGEAVGIATGSALGGTRSVAICQNSGLGNMVNPLTSLNYPFRIPVLLIITHRGHPSLKDEPQHELMGQITGKLLDTMGIPWASFPKKEDHIEEALHTADLAMKKTELPYAFIMEKGSVQDFNLKEKSSVPEIKGNLEGDFILPQEQRPTRMEVLELLQVFGLENQAATIATTGKTGRELFQLGHHPNQLYLVGSMGCASAVGLGVHETVNRKKPTPFNVPVNVIDGDGAALMKLGAFATIGRYQPKKLRHFLLDNESHDSTGGQATHAAYTDFATIAHSCRYQNCWRTDRLNDLQEICKKMENLDGPHFIHVKIQPGSTPNLGRPTLKPFEVKEQFSHWLNKK